MAKAKLSAPVILAPATASWPMQKIALLSLLCLVATLPLLLSTTFYEVFEYPKLLVFFIYTALSLPLLLLLGLRKAQPLWTYGLWIAFVAVTGLSSVHGNDPHTGLVLTHKRYFCTLFFAAAAYFYFWIGQVLKNSQQAITLSRVMLVPIVPLFIYGGLQYLGHDFIQWEMEFGRAFATLGSPLHLSLFCAMLVPLCLSGVWNSADLRRQSIFLGLLTMALATSYLAYSRGSWLALGYGIYVLTYLTCAAPKRWLTLDFLLSNLALSALVLLSVFHAAAFRGWTIIPIGVCIAAYLLFTGISQMDYRSLLARTAILLGSVFFMLSAGNTLYAFAGLLSFTALALLGSSRQRLSTLCIALILFGTPLSLSLLSDAIKPQANIRGQVIDKTSSLQLQRSIHEESRVAMWQCVRPWLRDYFWLGSGPQTTREIFPRYRSEAYAQREGRQVPPNHLHSDYLNTLVTGGVLGLLAQLLLAGGLCVAAWQNIRHDAWVGGLVAGMLVYLVAMLVGFPNVSTYLLFVTLAALATHRSWQNETLTEVLNLTNPYRALSAAGASILTLLLLLPLTQHVMAEWNFKQGILYHSTGRAKDSLAFLQRASELMPRDAYYWAYTAEVYKDLYQDTQRAEYHTQAIAALKTAAALMPSSESYVIRQADILAANPSTAKDALPLYAKAHHMDPKHPSVLLNWGNTLLQLGQIAAAKQKYFEVIAMGDAEMSSRANYNLGLAYLNEGKPELALQTFKAVTHPSADSLMNVGLTYKRLGDYANAAKALTQMTDLFPNDPAGHYELGILMLQQNLPLPAIAELKQALHLSPNNFPTQFNLGVANWKAKQYEQAKFHFRMAQQLEPHSPAIIDLQKKINF